MTEIKFTSQITVRKIQDMGSDRVIMAAMLVSTNPEDAVNLAGMDDVSEKAISGRLNYLMKHRHGSPFEHSTITFYVHAPICVFREWHRHRVMSYNEESARYKQLDPLFYIPEPNRPMIPSPGFKSARPNFRLPSVAEYDELVDTFRSSYTASYAAYAELLGADPDNPRYDRGLARDVLPVGIYSSCWVTCNPRSLMHFLSLRVHDEAATYVSYPLWEIELAARQAERLLAEGWPLTYEAFVRHGRVAP